jgi:hypothetical protein
MNPLIDLPRISERGSAAALCGKALLFRQSLSFMRLRLMKNGSLLIAVRICLDRTL